ncbi:hypothetical protein LCGC14_0746260 [marine sediment metagenome]|uniref:Uncharacterized protein n=1 Tax=marine sediment metagenome TaxID=412755 RepID=A0A0F9SQB6_9ZZZZ
MEKTDKRIPAARVARILGVSRDTAIRMIQRGDLKGDQTLTRWWATQQSVDRYLAQQQEAAAS